MEDLEFQVKRVRISFEASTISTQEIDNEMDIGRSIMTNTHNVMCFPFAVNIQESINYISISNHAHKGRFHDPPISSAEKDYQEYFRQQCIPLTDYRTARAVLKYDNSGWQWLITLLQRTPEELGWRESEISYNNNSDCIKLLKWLGHERTAQVFEGIVLKGQHADHRIAVKIARNSMCKKIKEEVDILTTLKGSDGIPNVLFSNENSFVMKPLCYKIYSFNKLDLDRIINIIQNVHTQGIVHRDLRRCNILRDRDTGTVHVMDWGYAVNIINLSLPFAGGLDCASDLVLESVRDRKEIVYQKSDDLISLLRSFYLVLHGQVGSVALPLGNTNCQEYARFLENPWEIQLMEGAI
ncbi:92_t:CDS:2 [Entrophospora sp. SA101]|nr:92_t:CDS:2 [Entrophospora sp. SA101]